MNDRAPGRRWAIPLAAGAVAAVVLGTIIGVTLLSNRPEAAPPGRQQGATPSAESDGSGEMAGCRLFPADNYWHADVTALPVHPMSDTYLDSIGREAGLHADFGAGLFEGESIGIPYVVVGADQPDVQVSFRYADESDPGPYPIPADAPIEGGLESDGDRHVLVIDRDSCTLSELWAAHPQDDGGWEAGSGAVFDLGSNELRPQTWTSADAAGLPILPGLIRYQEVAAGEIDHAIRFTVEDTQDAFLWPARHEAGDADPSLPPMGLWLRLKASFDISRFPDDLQVILRATQLHGLILADNGASMFLTGVPDDRWDNETLALLREVTVDDFQAVDVTSLIVDPDSGQASR